MEGNRDEAEKCVEIAREALNAGNREKAQRFLQKAEKLYPLPSARGEALSVRSLPAGSPDRRVARPRPHHRPSGNRRHPGPARPRRRAPGGTSRHTPAPAPTAPGWAWGGLPEIRSALACLPDAGSQRTDECCRCSGPFCKGLAVILPGDSSDPVLPEWGFINGCSVLWPPPTAS